MSDVLFGPFEVCEYFRLQALDALAACGSEPITTTYNGVAVPVWDDCCGTLVVSPELVYRTSEFPTEDVTDDHCEGSQIAVTILATLVRCVPSIDASGRPPSSAKLTAAHKRVLDDCAIMWESMTGPLADEEWDRAVVRQNVVVPTGGCVAIETRATIGMPFELWCGRCG